MSMYEIKDQLIQEVANLQEMAEIVMREQFDLERIRMELHTVLGSSENFAAAEALEAIEGLYERLGRGSLLLLGAQHYASAYEQSL